MLFINILSENQYGLQSLKSTGFTLSKLIKKVSTVIDNKMSIIGVFIDFKKAFKTKNH